MTTPISRRRRSGQGQDWMSVEWTGCGTSLPYQTPFSECRDAAQGLQPASPTSLTHSLALSRPHIAGYHHRSHINFRHSATVCPCSESFISCADAVVDAPPRQVPLVALWAKGGPMCYVWGSRLHITYKFAHCPWASSSSSQLTVFFCLVVGYFPIYFRLPPTTVAAAAVVKPPTTPILFIQRRLPSQFPGKLLSPATMSAAVGMDFPVPLHPLSSREPSTLIPLLFAPDHHLQQSYIQCMRKSGLNERL